MFAAAHGYILATCGQRQTYLASLIQATATRQRKEASDTEGIGSDTTPPINSPASRSTAQREPLDPGKSTVGFMQPGTHVLNLYSCTTTLACTGSYANSMVIQVIASIGGVIWSAACCFVLQATRRAYTMIRCRVELE
jgi:hypothetical protein